MSDGNTKAAATRRALLEAASQEMLVNGFRATSVDNILEQTGVTKGALYYHFKSKDELGLAVIDELYRNQVLEEWGTGLDQTDNPVNDLLNMLRFKKDACSEESVRCGCPLNNLAQEMAPVNEAFRLRIEDVFESWRELIADALDRGKANQTVKDNLDSKRAAIFITSLIEGAVGAAKNAQDPAVLESALGTLELFVETVRPGVVSRGTAAGRHRRARRLL